MMTLPEGQTTSEIGELYEAYIAVLIKLQGYNVAPTPHTGDKGADLLVFTQSDEIKPLWAIQCKCHNTPVGVGGVQEIYAATAIYNARYGAVVSPLGFTSASMEMADKLGIKLLTVNRHDWHPSAPTVLPPMKDTPESRYSSIPNNQFLFDATEITYDDLPPFLVVYTANLHEDHAISLQLQTGSDLKCFRLAQYTKSTAAGDIAAVVTNLAPDNVLIITLENDIDIDHLNLLAEAAIYNKMDITIGKGSSSRTVTLDLPSFKVIFLVNQIRVNRTKFANLLVNMIGPTPVISTQEFLNIISKFKPTADNNEPQEVNILDNTEVTVGNPETDIHNANEPESGFWRKLAKGFFKV